MILEERVHIMLNVALLSRWHVHADDYARDIRERDDIQIGLIWDEDANRGEQWANELDVPFEADLDKVLSNPEIDGVIVNTPTNLHKEVIIKAAEHGKHIFTEKVLAFTVEDCEAIYDAVEKAGVHLMVSLPRLTDRNFMYADKAVKEGWLGQLSMVRCRFAHNGAVAIGDQETGWLPARFFDKEEAGGGAMIDLGAHPIYLLNRFAGKADAVYARLANVTDHEVDDNSALLVDYDSGVLGIVETSFVSHGSPFQFELYGTEGTMMISDHGIQVNSMNVNDGQLTTMDEPIETLPMPMVQWIRAIQSNETPTITKDDVVQLTLLNEAAFISHEEGRRVKVEEILK